MIEQNKHVCVITGAGSGIGAGLVRYAVQQGMYVVGTDVDSAGLEEVAASLGDRRSNLTTHTVDVTDAKAVEELAHWVFSTYGKVNFLFNNAGVLVDGKSWERPLRDWRWIIGVNIMGVIHGIHYFVPRMLQQGDTGQIINTASIGGLLGGGTYMSPYQCTKHAVVVLTESLYKELAAEDASVSASVLCPAEVATRIWHSDRLRSEEERTTLGTDEQKFHDTVSSNVAAGPSPDEFAPQVFAGIEAGHFWLIPDASFTPMLEQRTADILLQRNPETVTQVDF